MHQLIQISTDELLNLIRQAVSEELCKINLDNNKSDNRAPATRQEACRFLNISIPTLDKLIKSNQLPTFTIGRQVRIKWIDLLSFNGLCQGDNIINQNNLLSNTEIFERKAQGDYVTVANMLSLTPEIIRVSLNTPSNKHHKAVCKALSKVILERENFIPVVEVVDKKKYASFIQATKLLNITKGKLNNYIEDKRIPITYINQQIFFKWADLYSFCNDMDFFISGNERNERVRNIIGAVKHGDFVTAGRMINTTPDVVRMTIKRPSSSLYKKAINALEIIQKNRI